MQEKFFLELLFQILFVASTFAFVLALGAFAVPEKRKIVPFWLRIGIIVLFLTPVFIELYLTYFTSISLGYRRTSGNLKRSALTSAIVNSYPYNLISFIALFTNVILGYKLHRILWKNRTKT